MSNTTTNKAVESDSIINQEMRNRDIDMDILTTVIKHCSKEIYEATRSHSGFEIASCAGDTLELILLMKRAAELLDNLYTENTSLSV